jgi:hypothetical protein
MQSKMLRWPRRYTDGRQQAHSERRPEVFQLVEEVLLPENEIESQPADFDCIAVV